MLSIFAATAVASVILFLFGLENDATIRGGFVPGLVGFHVAASPDAPFMLPFWLTPVSATLIHAGWVHLGFNLFALGLCGDKLERTFGWRALAVLYVIGAYAAAAGYWLQEPASAWPLIGANGAVSALVGGYALLFGRSRARAIGPAPARVVAILWLSAAWIGLQVLIGLGDLAAGMRAAIGSSIGGLLAGLVFAKPLLLWHYRSA